MDDARLGEVTAFLESNAREDRVDELVEVGVVGTRVESAEEEPEMMFEVLDGN